MKEIAKTCFLGCVHFVRRALFTLFSVCPLEKKVFFSNFSGKRYGDNPAYISEKLHERMPDCQIVWQRRTGYDFEVPDYVRLVKYGLVRAIFEMSTSSVWVDSHLKYDWIKKRKDQFFIETWHGGLGFKKIEGDVDNLEAVKLELKGVKSTVEMANLFISNSEWLTKIYRRAFGYSGEIMECGFPRNDVFFTDNTQTVVKVKQFFQVKDNQKIILYAPTFRDVIHEDAFAVDFQAIRDAIQKRFATDCVVLVRLHPVMMKLAPSFYEYNESVINATDYPVVQDLVLAADYMITDYSSTVFDFMLMRRPAFLFTADYETYSKERGFYHPLDYYPFPSAKNNQEMVQNIICFDDNEYQSKISSFIKETGLKETGHATEDIVSLIIDRLNDF